MPFQRVLLAQTRPERAGRPRASLLLRWEGHAETSSLSSPSLKHGRRGLCSVGSRSGVPPPPRLSSHGRDKALATVRGGGLTVSGCFLRVEPTE